jgi:ABC-2 type transport system ATP-binding protein
MKMSQAENKSVIISSHITDDIARIADYIAFIIEGRIALFSEKGDLLSNWKRVHYKKAALDSHIIDSLKNRRAHMFGSSGVTAKFLEIKSFLASGIASEEIIIENVNLDDVLITLVEGE